MELAGKVDTSLFPEHPKRQDIAGTATNIHKVRPIKFSHPRDLSIAFPQEQPYNKKIDFEVLTDWEFHRLSLLGQNDQASGATWKMQRKQLRIKTIRSMSG